VTAKPVLPVEFECRSERRRFGAQIYNSVLELAAMEAMSWSEAEPVKARPEVFLFVLWHLRIHPVGLKLQPEVP
jgi:hypothetical protein